MNCRRDELYRAILGWVLPLSLVVITLLPLLIFRERLPDPIATHWGAGGEPNASMTFGFLVVFQALFVGIPAIVMAILARRAPVYRREITLAVGIASFVATVTAVVSWQVVGVNLDAVDWSQSGVIGWAHLGAALSIAAMLAVIASMLARSIETDAPQNPVTPHWDLAPGVRAVWVGTARSKWAAPVVIGLAGTGVALALSSNPGMGLFLFLIALPALPM